MSKLYDLLSAMCGKIKKPDWEQNNPTAADYVKNRPFWESDPVFTEVVPETTVFFEYDEGGPWNVSLSESVELLGDKQYTVYWNNVPYDCIAIYGYGGVYIGNPYLFADEGIDNGLPFFIISDFEGLGCSAIAPNEEGMECTIKVTAMLTEVQIIDKKFLPPMVKLINHNMDTDEETELKCLIFETSKDRSEYEASFTIDASGLVRIIVPSIVMKTKPFIEFSSDTYKPTTVKGSIVTQFTRSVSMGEQFRPLFSGRGDSFIKIEFPSSIVLLTARRTVTEVKEYVYSGWYEDANGYTIKCQAKLTLSTDGVDTADTFTVTCTTTRII